MTIKKNIVVFNSVFFKKIELYISINDGFFFIKKKSMTADKTNILFFLRLIKSAKGCK